MNNVTLGHISKQKLKEGLGTVGKEVVGTQWQCTVVFSITLLTNTLIHITNTCRPFPKCERFHEIHKIVIVDSDGLNNVRSWMFDHSKAKIGCSSSISNR